MDASTLPVAISCPSTLNAPARQLPLCDVTYAVSYRAGSGAIVCTSVSNSRSTNQNMSLTVYLRLLYRGYRNTVYGSISSRSPSSFNTSPSSIFSYIPLQSASNKNVANDNHVITFIAVKRWVSWLWRMSTPWRVSLLRIIWRAQLLKVIFT
jgi:hypothetical protein